MIGLNNLLNVLLYDPGRISNKRINKTWVGLLFRLDHALVGP